jgi:hypothetical protein
VTLTCAVSGGLIHTDAVRAVTVNHLKYISFTTGMLHMEESGKSPYSGVPKFPMIPSFHKIRSNAPRHQSANPLATPNIIRNKTQQLMSAVMLLGRLCSMAVAQLFNRDRPWLSTAES